MKRRWDMLLGEQAQFSFEQRIFHSSMLFGIVLTVFGTVMDVIYKSPILIDLAFIGCWTLTYCLSRFANGFRIVSIVSIAILVFAFIPYLWVESFGLQGSIPFYTILTFAFIAMILHGKHRIAAVASLMAVVLLLICYDASRSVLVAGNYVDIGIHLFVVLIATVAIVIVYSNTYMKEKRRAEAYTKQIEEQARQQLYTMENLEQLVDKLKSERHDFNNHLSVLHGLLENGESDSAKAYVAQKIKEAVEYQNFVNIPYPAVRALLNHKLSLAKQNGIALLLDVGLPDGMALNEFDLSVILGNLMDNAIEACKELREAKPYIELMMRNQMEYLVMRIKNPANPAPNMELRSTKSDPQNHGFGLQNVEYLVGKYNGLMEIKRESGMFEADIALLIE